MHIVAKTFEIYLLAKIPSKRNIYTTDMILPRTTIQFISPEGFKQSLLVQSLLFFLILTQRKGKRKGFLLDFRGLN